MSFIDIQKLLCEDLAKNLGGQQGAEYLDEHQENDPIGQLMPGEELLMIGEDDILKNYHFLFSSTLNGLTIIDEPQNMARKIYHFDYRTRTGTVNSNEAGNVEQVSKRLLREFRSRNKRIWIAKGLRLGISS